MGRDVTIVTRWLMPSLSVTMPSVANLAPWLLLVDVLLVAGAIGISLTMKVSRERLEANVTTARAKAIRFHEAADNLRKARNVILLIAGFDLAFWALSSMLFGLSSERNELLLSLVLGLIVLPSSLCLSILSEGMKHRANRRGS